MKVLLSVFLAIGYLACEGPEGPQGPLDEVERIVI